MDISAACFLDADDADEIERMSPDEFERLGGEVEGRGAADAANEGLSPLAATTPNFFSPSIRFEFLQR